MGRSGEYSQTFAKCGINVMNKLNISFTGEYQYTIDNKGRLNIPAKFRKALHPDNDRTFVITRGFDSCLTLYPITEWNIVEQQLASLSSIRNRNREFVRSIVRYASYVQYDKQGRIIIPDNLKVYATIDREVSIIGMISKIEIWSSEKIKKHDNNQMNIDEFDDLADDISF